MNGADRMQEDATMSLPAAGRPDPSGPAADHPSPVTGAGRVRR